MPGNGPSNEGAGPPVRTLPSKWGPVALVCRKCGKKLGGGFGPKGGRSLPKALARHLKHTGRRRAVRVAETGCLGICPGNAVAVALHDRVLAVPRGADMDAVLAAISPPAAPPATAAGSSTTAGPAPAARP